MRTQQELGHARVSLTVVQRSPVTGSIAIPTGFRKPVAYVRTFRPSGSARRMVARRPSDSIETFVREATDTNKRCLSVLMYSDRVQCPL